MWCGVKDVNKDWRYRCNDDPLDQHHDEQQLDEHHADQFDQHDDQLHEHHADHLDHDQLDQHDDQPVKVEGGVEDVETPIPVRSLLIS